MDNRKNSFVVMPATTLIISIFMWIFFWWTLFFGQNFFLPVIESMVFTPVVDQAIKFLFYLAWFVLGPAFTLLNSWRLNVKEETIFFYKFFGVIKKVYTTKEISAVNLQKASKKRIVPRITFRFADGQKLKIEHGTIGFTKMWEYLNGDKEEIFIKRKGRNRVAS
jgi:hypothetical protein